MAERHSYDYTLNDSGDSELVINFPADDVEEDSQADDTLTHAEANETERARPNSLCDIQVEITQTENVNDNPKSEVKATDPADCMKYEDASIPYDTCDLAKTVKYSQQQPRTSPSFLVEDILPSSKTGSSQQLPGISSIISRPDHTNTLLEKPAQDYQHPFSFWEPPDYGYTLNSELYYQIPSQQQQENTSSIYPYPPTWPTWDFLQQISRSSSLSDTLSHNTDKRQQQQNAILFPPPEQTAVNCTTEPTNKREKKKSANPAGEEKVYKRYPKPPYTYAGMSIMAIENSPNKALQYREVTDALRKMFPSFFNGEYQGWLRSVRHVLSRMDCFYHEQAFDGTRNCFWWKVDLSKVKREWFMRQDKKEDLRATEHEFKPYLHEELNVPPILLPERQCENNTIVDEESISRAVRNIFLLNQQNQMSLPTHVETATKEPSELNNEAAKTDNDVVLPQKPSNYKLNSVSTLVTDNDDFLGAKVTANRKASAEDVEKPRDSSPESSTTNDSDIKNFGLPSYLLDVPAPSPIPHDIYRDTEGIERYCPLVDSSSSASTSSVTSSMPASMPKPLAKSKSKKRKGTSTGSHHIKKAKISPSRQLQDQWSATSDSKSLAYIPPIRASEHDASLSFPAASFYPTEPYNQYLAGHPAILPTIPSQEADKPPLCWPPVENSGMSLPMLPFGYPTEHLPWQHSGYQYPFPQSYGYPTYDPQYGIDTNLGCGYSPRDTSSWFQLPYSGAVDLCKKPDSTHL